MSGGRRCSYSAPKSHPVGAVLPEEAFTRGQYACKQCKAENQREVRARKRGRSPPVTRANGEPPQVMDAEKTPTTPPPVGFSGTADECILWFSDAHFPFNDPYWWGLFLETARVLKPTRIIGGGDLHDCRGVSQHERMSEHDVVSFNDERAESNRRLDELAQAQGNSRVHMIGGNHEHRLVRYLLNIAPAFGGLDELKIENLYGYTRRGWDWMPYRDEGPNDGCLDIGSVTYTHDLERAGVNAIRQAVADYRRSVVIGHLHRLGVWYEGDARGNSLFGACFGWGGDSQRLSWRHRRRARREWSLGFGVIWHKGDLAFPQPVQVVNKTAVIGSKILRAL